MQVFKQSFKKPESLKRAEYNPRQITKGQYEQLKKSVVKFGFIEPLVINTTKDREDVIISGHQRLNIAIELKYNKVPCIEVKLPIEKEKELNIRLNKNGGTFDFDILANYFSVNELKDWGFKDIELGFNIDKITDTTNKSEHLKKDKEDLNKFSVEIQRLTAEEAVNIADGLRNNYPKKNKDIIIK
tara:strand:- start:7760 stop:8317 length:558 start_codon:yes stop_codon:yes gene_type:complete